MSRLGQGALRLNQSPRRHLVGEPLGRGGRLSPTDLALGRVSATRNVHGPDVPRGSEGLQDRGARRPVALAIRKRPGNRGPVHPEGRRAPTLSCVLVRTPVHDVLRCPSSDSESLGGRAGCGEPRLLDGFGRLVDARRKHRAIYQSPWQFVVPADMWLAFLAKPAITTSMYSSYVVS